MNDRLRAVLLGLAVALVILLLDDLAGQLGGPRPGSSSGLWALAAVLVAGAVAAYGAAFGRRDALTPAVAAAVLAWPLLAALTPLPDIPGWVPLIGETNLGLTASALLVGVLVTGAVVPRRLG